MAYEWSFGILTDGLRNNYFHESIVSSIKHTSVKNYEIIFITENKNFKSNEKIVYVDIPSSYTRDCEKIAFKNNLFAKNAQYDNLCIMHDYIKLDENFGKGFDEEEWDVCSIPLLLPNGKRWWDWRLSAHPVYGCSLVSYDCKATQWHFPTGNLFMVKKIFLLKNPMPEKITEQWACPGSEDYEWAVRMRSFWKYICNKNTTAYSLKDKPEIEVSKYNINLII